MIPDQLLDLRLQQRLLADSLRKSSLILQITPEEFGAAPASIRNAILEAALDVSLEAELNLAFVEGSK